MQIVHHVDSIVTINNPAVLPDGSNISDAPCAQIDPHICTYNTVVDFQEDLAKLVATCQRHTEVNGK